MNLRIEMMDGGETTWVLQALRPESRRSSDGDTVIVGHAKDSANGQWELNPSGVCKHHLSSTCRHTFVPLQGILGSFAAIPSPIPIPSPGIWIL